MNVGRTEEKISCLDLPSETEIGGYVGLLLTKHRKGQQVTSVPSNCGVQESYLKTLMTLLGKTPSIRPAIAWTRFQEIHPTVEDSTYSIENQFKLKLSTMRRKGNS